MLNSSSKAVTVFISVFPIVPLMLQITGTSICNSPLGIIYSKSSFICVKLLYGEYIISVSKLMKFKSSTEISSF